MIQANYCGTGFTHRRAELYSGVFGGQNEIIEALPRTTERPVRKPRSEKYSHDKTAKTTPFIMQCL